jgi:hypothetical protein
MIDKKIREREEIIGEFEQLIKDFQEVGIHLKKRPDDYNEPHYLIFEAEEFHPVAELYARIGPNDDGSIHFYMMGSPLEQRVVKFIENNITDEKVKRKIIHCVKENMPPPPEEEKIKQYLEKEAKKFKRIRLEVHE